MVDIRLLIDLSHNISLLLALTFIFGFMRPWLGRFPLVIQQILHGLVFGVFGIVSVLTPSQVMPGFIVDGRSIIIAIAAVFGGAIPATITPVLISVCRFWLGVPGASGGVTTAIVVAGLGYGLHVYMRRRDQSINLRFLVLFGGVVALVDLLFAGLFAGGELVKLLAIPLLTLYPSGIVTLGLLLIHQRHQFEIEEALREKEERYRSVITAMSEGVIMCDIEGVIKTHNRSAEIILGLSAGQLDGSRIIDLPLSIINEAGVPSDTSISHYLRLRDVNQQGAVHGVYRPDGTLAWLWFSSRPLRKPDSSEPYAYVTTFMDISARKLAEETVAQERDLLRTLIDSTPDYIFIKDSEGRFEVSNEAHAQAVHVEPDELVGKTAFDMFPLELAAQFHYDDMAVIESGQPLFNLERTTVDSEGNFKTVLTTKVPLHNRDGKATRLVGISRDITERKLMERQAVELTAERQRVKALRQFITSISHDFRTPLTSINNHVYLLEKTDDPARQQEHREIIETQVMRMSNMLDEMLQMEQLEREGHGYLFSPVALNTLVGNAVRAYESEAATRRQILTFIPDLDAPPVTADTQQLSQAISSVIENALQYTPDGGRILVRTSAIGSDVLVAVEDTGIGISQEDLPHIFEHFYRADQARSTLHGNEGLGLAIARRIVEDHQGCFEVESVLGTGSKFVIKLPVTQAEALAG